MGIFLRFLNCVNGTKSHKASYKLYHRKRLLPKCYKQNAMNEIFTGESIYFYNSKTLHFLYIRWKALLIVTVKERCEYPVVRSIFIICFWLLEKFLFTEAVQNQCLNMSSGGLFIHPFIYLFIHKHIYCWSPKLAVIYKSNGNRIIQN